MLRCPQARGTLTSAHFHWLLREKAGNSLPGSQLAIEKRPERRKGFAKFARFEKMTGISRAALKFQLRAREGFKQQNAARTQRAGHLREKRSLQILKTQ